MPDTDELDPNLAAALLTSDAQGPRKAGDDEAEAAEVRRELARLTAAVRSSCPADPDEAEVRQAVARGRRLVADFVADREAPAVAGRIGRESDGTSDAWRVVRWPLAAAASLVAGLVLVTFLNSDTPGERFALDRDRGNASGAVDPGGSEGAGPVDADDYASGIAAIFDPGASPASDGEGEALAWVDADDIFAGLDLGTTDSLDPAEDDLLIDWIDPSVGG